MQVSRDNQDEFYLSWYRRPRAVKGEIGVGDLCEKTSCVNSRHSFGVVKLDCRTVFCLLKCGTFLLVGTLNMTTEHASDGHLSFQNWPTNLRNVAWSETADLAVAIEDVVIVLLPKLNAFETWTGQREDDQWIRFRLKANTFTEEEWPALDPLPGGLYSVGEEISQSHVVDLDWSRLGCGGDTGCALAVLTANGLLSIWVSEGDQHETKRWVRAFIVNHTLQELGDRLGTLCADTSRKHQRDRARLRHRIRSFAWAPRLSNGSELAKTKGHYLSVSNDLGQVVVVEVLPGDKSYLSWSSKIIAETNFCDLTPDLQLSLPLSLPFINCRRSTSDQKWGVLSPPLSTGDDDSLSIIVFLFNSRLRFYLCKQLVDGLELIPDRMLDNPPVEGEYTEPLDITHDVSH